MKFIFVSSLAALAAFVQAQTGKVGEPFGLLTIRSGSQLQYSTVKLVDNKLEVGVSGGEDFTGVFVAGNRIRIGDGPSYLGIDSDGVLVPDSAGSTFFVEDDTNLVLDGSSGFSAVPISSGGYTVGQPKSSSSDNIGVVLYIAYASSGKSSSAASSSAPASGNVTTVTTCEAPGCTTVTTCEAPECTGSSTGVNNVTVLPTSAPMTQVNGAVQTAVGVAGAVAGIAGALLL